MSQAGTRVATISLTLPLFVLLDQIKNLYDYNRHTGSSKSPSFGGFGEAFILQMLSLLHLPYQVFPR